MQENSPGNNGAAGRAGTGDDIDRSVVSRIVAAVECDARGQEERFLDAIALFLSADAVTRRAIDGRLAGWIRAPHLNRPEKALAIATRLGPAECGGGEIRATVADRLRAAGRRRAWRTAVAPEPRTSRSAADDPFSRASYLAALARAAATFGIEEALPQLLAMRREAADPWLRSYARRQIARLVRAGDPGPDGL